MASITSQKDFTLAPFQLDDKVTCKRIKTSFDVWKEVAASRYSTSSLAAAKHSTDASLAKKKAEDLVVKGDYFDVISYYKLAMSAKPNKDKVFHVLYDKAGILQAVSASTLLSKNGKLEVYVDYVISAAWNLSMHGTAEETTPTQLKGSGTALMFGAYQTALQANCTAVRLKPLANSASYYSYIGMQADGSEYVFPVKKETLPDKLAALAPKVQILAN